MFNLMKLRPESKIGYVWSKTRSLGQIWVKPLIHSRGTVLIKSSWNFVRLFVIIKSWPELKMGYVRLKTRSLSQFLEKKHVYCLEGVVLIQYLWNFVRMFIVIKSRPEYEWVILGQKTRSLGQFLEKLCVLSRRHSFDSIFMKLCQNDLLTSNRHLSRRAMLSDDSSCFY